MFSITGTFETLVLEQLLIDRLIDCQRALAFTLRSEVVACVSVTGSPETDVNTRLKWGQLFSLSSLSPQSRELSCLGLSVFISTPLDWENQLSIEWSQLVYLCSRCKINFVICYSDSCVFINCILRRASICINSGHFGSLTTTLNMERTRAVHTEGSMWV